jgi:hypothetical protein
MSSKEQDGYEGHRTPSGARSVHRTRRHPAPPTAAKNDVKNELQISRVESKIFQVRARPIGQVKAKRIAQANPNDALEVWEVLFVLMGRRSCRRLGLNP